MARDGQKNSSNSKKGEEKRGGISSFSFGGKRSLCSSDQKEKQEIPFLPVFFRSQKGGGEEEMESGIQVHFEWEK